MADYDAPIGGEHILTDEEKKQIVKKFLSRSPPGEIQIVAKDLAEILQDDAFLDAVAPEAFREWNEDQMLVVELPEGSGHVIVSKYAEVDRNQYINPRTGKVAIIDPRKQICTEVRPAIPEESSPDHVEEFRVPIDTALRSYVKEAFPTGHWAVYYTGWAGGSDGSSAGRIQLTAVISAAKLSPQNYWNGRWRSIWTLDIGLDDLSVNLKGQIRIDAHYFEEGNVQLNANYEVEEATDVQSPADCGEPIVDAIRLAETQYVANLDDFYSKLSDWQFKELRRKLPVTRTHFPWTKSVHQLAAELKKETQKR